MPELIAFTAVAVVLILTPGPDMALVTRNTVVLGRRAGLATSMGVCTGVLVHGCAAALGLSALLRTSSTAFAVIKLAGAAYLVYLGIEALRSARRGGDEADLFGDRRVRGGAPFRQGLLSNVLNPKLAVFFVTLLPQFIDSSQSAAARSLLLAGIYAGLCAAWLVAFTFAMSQIRDVLRAPRVTRFVEGITGTVLIAVGLRLAVDRR